MTSPVTHQPALPSTTDEDVDVPDAPSPQPADAAPPSRALLASASQDAARLAVDTLLRCWVRENGIAVPQAPGELRIDLPHCGVGIAVAVEYDSPCGWHRFGVPRLTERAPEHVPTPDTPRQPTIPSPAAGADDVIVLGETSDDTTSDIECVNAVTHEGEDGEKGDTVDVAVQERTVADAASELDRDHGDHELDVIGTALAMPSDAMPSDAVASDAVPTSAASMDAVSTNIVSGLADVAVTQAAPSDVTHDGEIAGPPWPSPSQSPSPRPERRRRRRLWLWRRRERRALAASSAAAAETSAPLDSQGVRSLEVSSPEIGLVTAVARVTCAETPIDAPAVVGDDAACESDPASQPLETAAQPSTEQHAPDQHAPDQHAADQAAADQATMPAGSQETASDARLAPVPSVPAPRLPWRAAIDAELDVALLAALLSREANAARQGSATAVDSVADEDARGVAIPNPTGSCPSACSSPDTAEGDTAPADRINTDTTNASTTTSEAADAVVADTETPDPHSPDVHSPDIESADIASAEVTASDSTRTPDGTPQDDAPDIATATVAAELGPDLDLPFRVLDSTRRVAAHLADRRARPDAVPGATPFLTAEQALLLGHPFHPAPKSRDGLTEAEARSFSPELRGSFTLHWFAADRVLVSGDSALSVSAAELMTELAGGLLPNVRSGPADTVLVPAHPWQARDLLHRPVVSKLIDEGMLMYLGPGGPAWYPTSSLRTVYRPGAQVMLKLSLGLRITNSRRENLRTELRRGIEMHRMLSAGLAAAIGATWPRLRILTDPAWLAVDVPPDPMMGADAVGGGLDVMIRQNPFGTDGTLADVACVAALVDLGHGATGADEPGEPDANRLASTVRAIARRRGLPVERVAGEWFERYLAELVLPILWLDAEHGVTLEAHQQNTLLSIGDDGMPVGGWYRDNQGFYLRESRVGDLAAFVEKPGVASASVVADDIVTERLCYYLGVNNLLGVIGAMGHAGLAAEEDLLRRAREALAGFAAERSAAGRPHDPTERLLSAPRLRCKANLLTRAAGLDELREPLARQSVYVDIENPIAAVARASTASRSTREGTAHPGETEAPSSATSAQRGSTPEHARRTEP
jgi:siderophore synthetase component